MLKKNQFAAVVMLTSLAASACRDLGVTSDPDVRATRTPVPAGHVPDATDAAPFSCFTAELRPTNGRAYRWAHVGLRFPAAEVPADGATGVFRLRVVIPGRAAPVAVANCRIPRSKAAARRLYARFAAMLRGRAALEPLLFAEPGDARRLYLGTRRGMAAGPGNPRLDSAPGDWQMPTVTATVTVYEGGATGWTGMDWGWGSVGDSYQTGGGTDSYDPGTPGGETATLKGDNDTIPKVIPDCNPPKSGMEKAYCTGTVADTTTPLYGLTKHALDRIRARGPACAAIADAGERLLDSGGVRFYSESSDPAAYEDVGGYGNANIGVLLDGDYWLRYYDGRDPAGRTFDTALAHEIEHTMGIDHVSDDVPYPTTPNANVCGG